MRFESVTTRRDLDRWLAFTDHLYPTDNFVPPIRQQLLALFNRRQPGTSADRLRFCYVLSGSGRVLARTTLHSEVRIDQKLGARVQLFGFTEFIDQYDVFRFLMDEVASHGRRAHRRLMLGPANLLPNDYGGVVTSNFNRPSFLDATYNHAYYPRYYDRYGFSPRFESSTFICDAIGDPGLDPDSAFPFDDARVEAERLEIRHGDRRRFSEQVVILHELLNRSFAPLDYYTEISTEEFFARVDGLAHLLDERLLLYLTREGKPVAFIVCMPDISPFLTRVRGDMHRLNLLRLWLSRRHFRREAVLLVKGTVPSMQGRGYMTLLSRELLRNLRSRGYRTLRCTSIEKHNRASAAQFQRMGGQVLHDLSYYQLTISP